MRKLLGIGHAKGHELARLNVLASMIASILLTGRSELRQMALGHCDRKRFGSKIKQYKRWLLNDRTGFSCHYLPFIEPLLQSLSKTGTLVFSIDGSTVGKGCLCLMFSVIYKGRAIPVIWKTYKRKKGHLPEKEHMSLLCSLRPLIPSGCRVVITGDGEFDGCEWQGVIAGNNWDYVLRTGKNIRLRESGGELFVPALVTLCQGENLFLEGVAYENKDRGANLLVWHGKGFDRPVFLITNLDYAPEIKGFYKKRFRIEPFFRDQKSKGFHIQRSGLRNPERLDKLLIATCLAYALGIMAGMKACKTKYYSEFARTDGHFLSLFQKGLRFIRWLVDVRQWRSFCISRDLPPEAKEFFDIEFCVPF